MLICGLSVVKLRLTYRWDTPSSTPSITKECFGISSKSRMIYARRFVLSELRANLDRPLRTNNSVWVLPPTQQVDRSRLNRNGVGLDCTRKCFLH